MREQLIPLNNKVVLFRGKIDQISGNNICLVHVSLKEVKSDDKPIRVDHLWVKSTNLGVEVNEIGCGIGRLNWYQRLNGSRDLTVTELLQSNIVDDVVDYYHSRLTSNPWKVLDKILEYEKYHKKGVLKYNIEDTYTSIKYLLEKLRKQCLINIKYQEEAEKRRKPKPKGLRWYQ